MPRPPSGGSLQVAGGSLQVAGAPCVAGACVGGAIAGRWFGRFHCRARCGGGFERFHCRGRRGGVFGLGAGASVDGCQRRSGPCHQPCGGCPLCHLRSALNHQVEAGSTIATLWVHQNPWCQPRARPVAATAFVYVHERSTVLGGGGITRGRPEWRAAPTAGDQSYRPAPSTTRLCRRRWHSAMTIGGLDRSVRAVPAERCR
jgi:hypothetical protein